ncbi:hypothetical protein MAPG_06354 [Magnaporthiopsis poae ATCC 64411]|uniref:Uncharacterized protein n=1 Tax=Magnaporthiopsis poae (strain ATCC 64411 / 73-15) TaxID=644358 RepID=A0A0C4E1T5_MAGP6|nr:hypothetical protein MAPG_06354 [Magnaporthiopsis poae ATCC 64411]
MCQTAFFKDPTCGCKWTAVTQPCWPGYGFSTCPFFFNGIPKEAPPYFKATKLCCPKHDLKGQYDRNMVRMVIRVENGLRWGLGAGRRDPGVDLSCNVM